MSKLREEGVMSVNDDLFRSTFRDSPIGMAVLDHEGRYTELNTAFARMLGMLAETLTKRHFSEFTHPDDLPRDLELFEQLIAGDFPYFQIQKRYIDAQGDTVWCRVTVTATEDFEETSRQYIAQIEDITAFRRATDLLEHRTLYDPLTGLANRTLLVDRLTHALASHSGRPNTVGVVFMDVDHFNVVNDSLGHAAGDQLLAEIGKRIQGAVRAGDTVARLGGDEFVLVFENIMSLAEAQGLAAVVTAAVQTPIEVAEHEVVPTVSAGLALAHGDITAETLIRDADTAMYAAKESGRAKIEVFSSNLRQSALHRLSIEAELRTAVRDGELTVHYQPVIDMLTEQIAAYEALVRWEHPTRGLLLPKHFIEISEESNLVVPLGAFVLHEACAFISRHPEFAGRVFINVSTRQIGTADLTRAVKSALASSGVDPRRIALEITESGMLTATKVARADLESIAALGVDLVLDDFGTGYSSLASVLQNPISGLKLSREFSSRLGDDSTGDRISTAVANLTRSIGMYGVVEGIETKAQYERAKEHGWTYGQGYLFGYPTPEHELPFETTGRTALAHSARRVKGTA